MRGGLTNPRISLVRERLGEGGRTVRLASPEAELTLHTSSGQARSVVLTERDLVRLIAEAADVLNRLQEGGR